MPEATPRDKHADIKLYDPEDWMCEDFVVWQKDRSIRRTIRGRGHVVRQPRP